jgi:hypothetical protein
MRRYLSAIAVALVALSGAVSADQQSTLPIVLSYDLDSTTFVYPIALGPTALPSTFVRVQAPEGWYETSRSTGGAVDRRIKTASYTADATSCVASGAAFDPLSVGDMVEVNDSYGRPQYASVFAKTDANNVTFDRPLDLTQTGCAYYKYRKLTAGANLYDGWFSVAGWKFTTIQISVSQMVVTGGIDVQVECQATPALTTAQVLASVNITAAGSYAVAIPEPWDMCRVGMKIGTSDSDATPATDNEKISVFAIRR